MVECEIRELNARLSAVKDMEQIRVLMQRAADLNGLKKELAKYLGERILSPRIRR